MARHADKASYRLKTLFAHRPGRSCALVGFAGFVMSALLALLVGWPVPQFHDEFSYLLAADTFASGRVVNPPHPLWEHFESFHINQQPTYCSIYPPAQGVMLALGQVIYHPAVGIWLGVAFACAAICWMLQAFVPPGSVALGSALALLTIVFGSTPEAAGYWSQSYWGGAVAALGGALVFGALRRLHRRVRVRYSLLLGLGLAILANARPFEGLIAFVPVMCSLIWLILRRGSLPFARLLSSIIFPIGVAGAAIMGVMLWYNAHTTGDPFRSAYDLNRATYTRLPHAPHFFWQSLCEPPSYNHKELWEYYVPWTTMMVQQNQQHFAPLLLLKMNTLAQFYFGWFLLLPVVSAMPCLLGNGWTRFAVITSGLVLTGVLALNFVFPHYAAPVAGLIILLNVQALRHVRVGLRRGRPRGLVRWMPLLGVCVFGCVQLALFVVTPKSAADDWHRVRARFIDECRREGGKHLVAVRYREGHNMHWEWVYNGADIDAAPVVWARLMSAEKNQRLFGYFKDRKIWFADIGHDIRITPMQSGRPR